MSKNYFSTFIKYFFSGDTYHRSAECYYLDYLVDIQECR